MDLQNSFYVILSRNRRTFMLGATAVICAPPGHFPAVVASLVLSNAHTSSGVCRASAR